MDKLLESLAVPWTRRWSGHVAAAAVVFWAVGPTAVILGSPTAPSCGRLCEAGPLGYALAAVLAVTVVVGSGLLVAAATPKVLHLLAGDLRPGGQVAAGLWERMLRRQFARRRLAASAGGAPPGTAYPDDLNMAERAMAKVALHGCVSRGAIAELYRYPRADALMAPTRTGCALAAMLEHVQRRHGLVLSSCWEHLLAVLPPDAQARLEQESRRVTLRGQNLVWAVAALAWTPVLPLPWHAAIWPVAVSVVIGLLHSGLREAVETYCDMIEAFAALYRERLYGALGLPVPSSTSADVAAGQALSRYLGGWSYDQDLSLSWPPPVPQIVIGAPNGAAPPTHTPPPEA